MIASLPPVQPAETREPFFRHAMWGLLLLGVLLRALLAWVNREAFDDHLPAVECILRFGRIPHLEDAFQAYHPKLYYLVCALVGFVLPLQTVAQKVVAFQYVNVVAGAATLEILRRFCLALPLPGGVRLAAFAGAALNPALIGTNAMASNESFAILFGTLSIYTFWRFMVSGHLPDAAMASLWMILANLSKASGLLLSLAATLCLLIRLVSRFREVETRKNTAWALAILLVPFFGIVPFAGEYHHNWVTYREPFKLNIPRSPAPAWFEVIPDPTGVTLGTTSLASSWFTFRPVELVRHPYIGQRRPVWPRHRDSLWSQVYGSYHFTGFKQSPGSWAWRDPIRIATGRGIMLLGFLGLAAFVLGIFGALGDVFRPGNPGPPRRSALPCDWIFLVFVAAAAGLIMSITYSYRAHFSMKATYLMPVMLCAIGLFARGLDTILRKSHRIPGVVPAVYGLISALYCLHTADVVQLIVHLHKHGPSVPMMIR